LDLEDYEVCSARAPDFMATTNKSYIFILWEYIYLMKKFVCKSTIKFAVNFIIWVTTFSFGENSHHLVTRKNLM
jgi:hypothetical protein